tara:strand:+ start:4409 stop:5614 length:1206 start_codon:yes stop_codon:yes gene_type:complete
MRYIVLLSLIFSLILQACTDSDTIGLELQPSSENIIISSTNFNNFSFANKSEDSLRADEPINLILGEIIDSELRLNTGSFYTQILLTENNIDLGGNPIVDSVVLSYTYSGYYGNLEEFTSLEVSQISEDIYKDSIYYSNSFQTSPGSIDNVEEFNLSENLDDPYLRVQLKNEFGQQILDLGNDVLKDNETFLQNYKGIRVLAFGSNTMLYLNPEGVNSYLKVYYHNDESQSDTLSLDFELGGNAARINLFNEKKDNSIINDTSRIYLQSMAGYKTNINLGNVDQIRDTLKNKVINKATITFDLKEDNESEFASHEKLFLVRVNNEGKDIFLLDFTVEGEEYFGGNLENGKYIFNITRYLYQLLYNDNYTSELYLLPAGAAVNANTTILNNDVKLQIYYSEL